MTESRAMDLSEYVAGAARLQGLQLSPEQLQDVTGQFSLLVAMAERLEQVPLPADCEPAPVYRP